MKRIEQNFIENQKPMKQKEIKVQKEMEQKLCVAVYLF